MSTPLKEAGYFESNAEMKRKLGDVLTSVSSALGNTVAVCRKYYIHPVIFEMYENGTISNYLDEPEVIDAPAEEGRLTAFEKILIKILECSTRAKN